MRKDFGETMKNYIHKVNYYETDKMGITHHSNYIRWMEEARIDLLEQVGYTYDRLEKEGVCSPVIGVECEYKTPTTFSDEIEIKVEMEEYTGVRMVIKYTMTNVATGNLVLVGKTKHCFFGKDNRPIMLKKEAPEMDAVMRGLLENK